MEVKKSPKADLNNKKLLFVEIGLILCLAYTGDNPFVYFQF